MPFYFFALILFCNFSFALTQDKLQTTVNEMYLLNPLDNSEAFSNGYSIIYNKENYWLVETSDKDLFIINDKNYLQLANKDIIKPVLETYFFFSKIDQKYNNEKIAYFFNTLPNVITNFNYNIELIKKEISNSEIYDENVLIALQNVQLRIKEIGEISIDITKNEMQLDNNLTLKSYDTYQNIKQININLSKDINSLIYKQSDLQGQIMNVKIILVDSNLPLELKSSIGNELLVLPSQFQNMPEYISNLSDNSDNLKNAKEYSENYKNIKPYFDSWDLRLKRMSFLQIYLGYDKDLEKTTKQKNPKLLFDYIIANKDLWVDYNKTVAFNDAYTKMYSDLEKLEYDSAKRQIKPLKDTALIIFKDGKKDVTSTTTDTTTDTTTEESNPMLTIAIIVAVGIVLVIIVISIIKKVKEANEEKEKEQDPEVEVKF